MVIKKGSGGKIAYIRCAGYIASKKGDAEIQIGCKSGSFEWMRNYVDRLLSLKCLTEFDHDELTSAIDLLND